MESQEAQRGGKKNKNKNGKGDRKREKGGGETTP